MKIIVYLVFILVITSGCSEMPLSPVIEKEVTFYDSPESPRELIPSTNQAGLINTLINFCWNEDLAKCNLEIINPTKSLQGKPSQLVDKGEKIRFLFDASPEIKSPMPTGGRLYLFEGDVPREVAFNSDGTFTVPEKNGRHTFGYLAEFDGDIKGKAYYGFEVVVK